MAGADYATLADSAATFQGLMGDGAIITRGEGDKMKEFAVRDFQQAMEWLIARKRNAAYPSSATRVWAR